MNMNSKKALMLLFVPLFLAGCALNTGIDGLLSPPKLDARQEHIYNALKSYTGENISLKYPKAGKNLSAFILEDIDGDLEDEAIVFYKKNTAKSEDASLRINILDNVNEQWKSVYDHAADGNEIEQVEVTRLGDSKRVNIIAGYSLINRNEKKISIYDYSDGKLNIRMNNESYSVFDTADYNGDGTEELFVASANTASSQASAVLYHLYDDGRYKRSALTLESAYTNYQNISCNNNNIAERNVFLDAETGTGNVVTEVFKVDEHNNLLQVFSPDTEKLETMRPLAYLSTDIDKDGKIEIPVTTFCNGYDVNSETPLYFTSWYEINDKKLKYDCESYYSITGGYIFMIPEKWYGKITAKTDTADNTLSICSGKNPDTAEEIFTIKIASGNEQLKKIEESGFSLIRTRGEKHFLVKINEKNPLALSLEETIMKFKFDY